MNGRGQYKRSQPHQGSKVSGGSTAKQEIPCYSKDPTWQCHSSSSADNVLWHSKTVRDSITFSKALRSTAASHPWRPPYDLHRSHTISEMGKDHAGGRAEACDHFECAPGALPMPRPPLAQHLDQTKFSLHSNRKV